jgi:serine/threonine-protein kinase
LGYGQAEDPVTAQELHDAFELVGKTLDGQYRVERVVGEGGFGVVYKGRHLALEQPIAIKALKVMDADDPAIQEALLTKFKEEAKLLYTLSQASLNIVRSVDFGSISAPNGAWAPYMVLEWLEGISLAEDLDRRRRRGLRGRSSDEAIALLACAAEGLAVAHERRVAHRDVKPANLFLVDDPKGAHLKVLDFGIAKVLRDDDKGGTRSKFASFTWAYAAPEQIDPRIGQQGLATDVYAFGLVLTEVLTDRQPVEARDVVAMVKAATDPMIRPTPRQRGANVPDWLETVCRRALAVDPRQRYPTLGELWHALTLAHGAPRLSQSGPHVFVGTTPGTVHQAPLPQAMAPSASRVVATPPPYTPPPPAPVAPAAPYGMQPSWRGQTPMTPYGPPRPPLQTGWGRRMVPAKRDGTMVLFVVLMVLSVLFVGTCAAIHRACGG